MSDSLFDSTLPAGQPVADPATATPTRWYHRRAVKVTATGVAAAAVVVGGFGVYASASTPTEPTAAIEAAFQNLGEGPVSVTVTSADEKDSSLTFTHTDAGTQVSVESPDGAFEAILNQAEQRVYLRVDTDEVTEVTQDPFLAGMLSGFSSVDALLNGDWVSVDVSEDSPVVSALKEADPAASDPDAQALTQAREELGAAVTALVGDLKDPAIAAITDNATVTKVDEGQSDSEHYRVDVDVAAAQADIEDDLRGAVDDLLAALDAFASTAGDAMPGMSEGLPKLRDELTDGLDEGLAEESGTETVDVYLADGQFTKIVADDLTLTFADRPALEDVSGAVSMDEDLVRLLPMMVGLMAMSDQLA